MANETVSLCCSCRRRGSDGRIRR